MSRSPRHRACCTLTRALARSSRVRSSSCCLISPACFLRPVTYDVHPPPRRVGYATSLCNCPSQRRSDLLGSAVQSCVPRFRQFALRPHSASKDWILHGSLITQGISWVLLKTGSHRLRSPRIKFCKVSVVQRICHCTL